MNTRTPVKVIKRDERNRQQSASTADTKTSAQSARDMVCTVSNWVSEFQQKRRTETSQALKALFPEVPQPSKV